MKHIIATITVLGLFMTATGFASTDAESVDLEVKLLDSIKDLKSPDYSLTTKKLILQNVIRSYSASSIKNHDLKEKIVAALDNLKPALNPRNFSRHERMLNKIK